MPRSVAATLGYKPANNIACRNSLGMSIQHKGENSGLSTEY